MKNELFVESYEHIEGDEWRRTGTVLARRALEGETIKTLEGPETAGAHDWVIKGARGEQWPVQKSVFKKSYEGPLPALDT